MQKLLEQYKKYKQHIILITITALLFFACFFEPLWIIASVLIGLFYITCNFGEILCYTVYFTFFSGIGTFYIVSLLLGFVVVAIKYILALHQKKEKFYVLPFVLTTLFVVVFSLINYQFDNSGFEQGVLVIALLYVFYFAFVYSKTIQIDKVFKFLMFGLIASLPLGFGSLLFNNFSYSIFYFDGQYNRLRLFCYHQNQLAMFCAFAISYFIYKLVNKKSKWYVCIVYIISCLVLGVFTLSKAFLVVVAGFIFYMIFYLIAKYKWKSLRVIVPFVAIVALALIFSQGLFEKIIHRFIAYNTTSSLINRITTGRSAIWYEYMLEITSSIPKMMFGVGLFNAELVAIGPHNVLVYFAYRVGAIGLVMLGVLCWAYYKESNVKIKLSYKNMLPLLTYLILSLNEMIFSDRFFFFLIIGILLTTTPKINQED